ncbi:hypothetical protein EAO68_25190 [Streptomyces sp. wa22]|nr:hypothetical protein EAO68_25190 [Streptomyces sp. wa22]
MGAIGARSAAGSPDGAAGAAGAAAGTTGAAGAAAGRALGHGPGTRRVDRGRIVREAVAVVLADLESRGDASTASPCSPRSTRRACSRSISSSADT